MKTLDEKIDELLKLLKTTKSEYLSWEAVESCAREAARIASDHEMAINDLNVRCFRRQHFEVVTATLAACAAEAELVKAARIEVCGGTCASDLANSIRSRINNFVQE